MIQRACIVGAGVAGLATALSLAREGVDVRVYERAACLRTFGGALTLWSNAVRALRELGLENAALAAGCPLRAMEFRSQAGKLLWTMPIEATSRRGRAETLVVPRSALLEILSRALPGVVHFEKNYVSYSERSRAVEVVFEDGEVARADLLVGADGARSALRALLVRDSPPYPTGHVIWVGRSRLRHPSLVPGVPVGTLGRGLRFWAAPMPDGAVWWYAIVQTKHGARTHADIQALFAGFHDPIGDLIDAVDPETFRCAEILDQPAAHRWSSHRVTLIGDAAHCTRPDVGQGACQALESALVLARCLRSESALGASLREYELSRAPRTAHVGFLARAVAFHGTIERPFSAFFRDAGVRTVFPLLARPTLEWLLLGAE